MVPNQNLQPRCHINVFKFKIAAITCLIIFVLVPPSENTKADEDLSLNHNQKLALDRFKERVLDKIPHDYMKQDVYLIRWLRSKDFVPAKAEQLLLANLKWRKDNNMDNILKEDFKDMETDYPYQMNTFDKEGKPVLFGEFGHWDLRNAEVTGRFNRLIRYGERIMEEEEALVRKLQGEGKAVTRTIIVFDMDGFNLAQHVCSRCISFLLQFYNSFEEHYPQLVAQIFIINNQPLVNMAFQSMLSSFAPQTRSIVRLYGRNKAEFSAALLQFIAPDQLPERYGGTKRSSK